MDNGVRIGDVKQRAGLSSERTARHRKGAGAFCRITGSALIKHNTSILATCQACVFQGDAVFALDNSGFRAGCIQRGIANRDGAGRINAGRTFARSLHGTACDIDGSLATVCLLYTSIVQTLLMNPYHTMQAKEGETLLVVRMKADGEFDESRFKSYFSAEDGSSVAVANICLLYTSKAKLLGRTPALSDSGTIPAQLLLDALQSQRYSVLPLHLEKAMRAEDAKIESGTAQMQSLEFALDAACYADMADYAQKSRQQTVVRCIQAQADLLNLTTLLRIRKNGQEMCIRDRRMGGNIPAGHFCIVPGGDVAFQGFAARLYVSWRRAPVSYTHLACGNPCRWVPR